MDEATALALATKAVDMAGGSRVVHGNPRHPFAINPSTNFEIDGQRVELRHGEISSPAIVTVEGYVFQVMDDKIELLMRMPKRNSRPDASR